jgi:hypothetical protein
MSLLRAIRAAIMIFAATAKLLVYDVTWETTICAPVAMLLHCLERLIDFWRGAGGFVAGNQKLLAEIV